MFSWFSRATRAPTEERLRMTKALVNYPLYEPPERKLDGSPEDIRAMGDQYREFFFDGLQTRISALSGFLANFDVALNSDDAGLMRVSAWLPQWADLLVNFDDKSTENAYRRLDVPWSGALTGLNVIFDLGVYYAECLWIRRTKIEWIVVRGSDASMHAIKGLPGGKYFDPMYFMYLECRNIRRAKLPPPKGIPNLGEPFVLRNDSFYRHVLANAPPGRRSRKSKQH